MTAANISINLHSQKSSKNENIILLQILPKYLLIEEQLTECHVPLMLGGKLNPKIGRIGKTSST